MWFWGMHGTRFSKLGLSGATMTEEEKRHAAQERVDRRFMGVSRDNPITALMYSLALEREQGEFAGEPCFTDTMHQPLPNAQQYLQMKSKVSLLPLDTLKEKMKLPSMPHVVMQLQSAIMREASSHEIASIIGLDPKLTAAVLSLVNSPLYAMPSKVESLERAITVIGNNGVSSLALGVYLLSMFEDTAPQELPLETFWKHSIASAVLANKIARLCNKPEPERFLVAGLLHDLGQILLFSRYPSLARVTLAMQQELDMPLHEAEYVLFDVDHTTIGGVLFGEWSLPRSIVNSALYHHDAEASLGHEAPEVVYVANQMATALGIGCNQLYTADPGEAIWESLGLREEDVRAMVQNVDEQLWAMFHTIFPGKG
ncbi:hypothetical protein DQK91_17000 [Oceanidesulfovibrio marinus]|uniref:HDOD domain-containing protein n=2 Tax=Oceanidesulfovibrio marinus TaxID=370038 RepID=A0A6P1ZGV9_9BACT|nr:hypothetical protein DQK91_17000 [Oceanidesulfovibrio marinus]